MSSYHLSNLGSLASRALIADVDGYVHLTAMDVLDGCWDESGGAMTSEQADEIAALNRRATDASTDKDPDQ